MAPGSVGKNPRIEETAQALREASARDFEQNGVPAMAEIPKRVTKAAERRAAKAAEKNGGKS